VSSARPEREELAREAPRWLLGNRFAYTLAPARCLRRARDEALREGDTLVVWKLDRLGRSVKHLVDLVGQLHKQGVQFKSLTDAIGYRHRIGPLLLSRRS